jgi:hypothetical protein
MKKIIYTITTLFLITINFSMARDVFISISADSYSNARSSASKLASSQGLYIVGQNYRVDHNNNWHVIFKLRPRN